MKGHLRRTRSLRTRLGGLAGLVVVLTLTACADFAGISPPQSHLYAEGPRQLAEVSPGPQAAWWREFGDERLNTLVDQALAGSPGLRLVQARLARAQAGLEQVDAARRPQANASLDVTHQRFTATGPYPPPLAGSVRDTATLQLGGSWELDFFGKNEAALGAALGQARAAQADADAARVLLASAVVRQYVQIARLDALREVTQRSLLQRQSLLDLVRARLQAGLDTQLELRQSEQGLPELRQQLEVLQGQLQSSHHALTALIGQSDMSVHMASPGLDSLWQAPVPQRLPVNVLGQRADIAAARWRVEAATQDVFTARSQFYPNVNLVGFAGLSSIGLGRLHESGSLQWGVGPAVRLPVFDAGRLRSNLRVRHADLDAAVESYNAAVLDALHEVADQLTSVQSIARQQAEQQQSQAAAQAAYDIAAQRYRAGLGTRMQVLSAQAAVLSQQRAAVDLKAGALEARVALLRALGGFAPLPLSSPVATVRPAEARADAATQVNLSSVLPDPL